MITLPNPWLTESPSSTGGHQEAPAASHRTLGAAGLLEPPALRDEPLPLFLTEPNEQMDRELEAMLRVHFGF